MKTKVGQEFELKLWWKHEILVNGAETPVQDADKYFQRSRADGEKILNLKEGGGQSQIGQEANDKSAKGQGEAYNRKKLVVASICF